jgi:hypothetical protein
MVRWIYLPVLPLLLLGCKKAAPDDKLTGTWLGDPPMFTNMKNDPGMRQFSEMMRDTVRLELNRDHTYMLDFFARKTGKWTATNRLVRFEEESSKMPFSGFGDNPFEIGEVNSKGVRTYTAVMDPGGKSMRMSMGEMGETSLHR